MSVIKQNAVVYFSPLSGRRFLSVNGALSAESREIIKRRYPTQKGSFDDSGRSIGDGFHWSDLPRSDVLYRRVFRMVKMAYKRNRAINGSELIKADSGVLHE